MLYLALLVNNEADESEASCEYPRCHVDEARLTRKAGLILAAAMLGVALAITFWVL